MKTLYKTLLLEMRHGFMDTMLKQKLSHQNGCQEKGHHDGKKLDKCDSHADRFYFGF
jgi:hypothetical protein